MLTQILLSSLCCDCMPNLFFFSKIDGKANLFGMFIVMNVTENWGSFFHSSNLGGPLKAEKRV